MRKQDTRGRFTKEMSILITKELRDAANEVEVRIKPIVRDELVRAHRANIYDSYTPAVDGSYHHKKLIIKHVKGRIDGNAVKAVIEDVEYPDDVRSPNAATSTVEVYEILKNGSTAHPKADSYPYRAEDGEMRWSMYIQQKPHNFEQRTLDDMEMFLDKIKSNPEVYLKPYLIKYKNKRLNK